MCKSHYAAISSNCNLALNSQSTQHRFPFLKYKRNQHKYMKKNTRPIQQLWYTQIFITSPPPTWPQNGKLWNSLIGQPEPGPKIKQKKTSFQRGFQNTFMQTKVLLPHAICNFNICFACTNRHRKKKYLLQPLLGYNTVEEHHSNSAADSKTGKSNKCHYE